LYGQWAYAFTTETLLDRNPNTYELAPGLASQWNISKDGKVFTFTLRDGAQWHDGQPVTAEDVKFSYDIVFKNDYLTAPMRSYFSGIEKMEIVDSKTVRFTAKDTYWQNFDVVANLMLILPKHIYLDSKNKKLNKEIVASGPYKLSSYERGVKLVLERNPNWWGFKEPVLDINKGRYNFAKVVFKFIKDETVQIETLKKEEVDFLRGISAEGYFKKMVGPDWGKSVFKVKAENLSAKTTSFVGWNLKHDMFKDKKVRIALAHLFNRELINQKFMDGASLLATGPWYQQNQYASKKIKPIKYDPKEALKLFKEAGWSDSDKDGLLDKTIDGKKVDFKFSLLTANADTMKYFTVFKEDAKKAGVEIEIKLVEWNTFTKLLDERNFDSVALGWGGEIEYDPKQIWHSSSMADQGSNFISYNVPEVDKMIDEARTTLDKKKRTKLLQAVYERIADDAPYLFLFNPKYEYYAHSKGIQKAKDTLTYDIGFHYWWATKIK
jgi:microcin C transport system substrate-binding protein